MVEPVIRTVKPEILDSLPEDHPEALQNRRDITKFNLIMGNFGWFVRTLPEYLKAGDRILEIGAGSGDLEARLRNKALNGTPCQYDGLDVCSRPGSWSEKGLWHREDLTEFEGYGNYTVVLTSLILHQFEEEVLRELGRKLAENARVIIASEPARRKLHLHQLKLSKLMLTNAVTDHDARASVEAGFIGEELPAMLGLDAQEWAWDCRTGFLGQYRMIAERR